MALSQNPCLFLFYCIFHDVFEPFTNDSLPVCERKRVRGLASECYSNEPDKPDCPRRPQ